MIICTCTFDSLQNTYASFCITYVEFYNFHAHYVGMFCISKRYPVCVLYIIFCNFATQLSNKTQIEILLQEHYLKDLIGKPTFSEWCVT